MGFEPMMRVLQTLALPLGHVADLLIEEYAIILTDTANFHKENMLRTDIVCDKCGLRPQLSQTI